MQPDLHRFNTGDILLYNTTKHVFINILNCVFLSFFVKPFGKYLIGNFINFTLFMFPFFIKSN